MAGKRPCDPIEGRIGGRIRPASRRLGGSPRIVSLYLYIKQGIRRREEELGLHPHLGRSPTTFYGKCRFQSERSTLSLESGGRVAYAV